MTIHELIVSRALGERFIGHLIAPTRVQRVLTGRRGDGPDELATLSLPLLGSLLYALAREHRSLADLVHVLREGPSAVLAWLDSSADDRTQTAAAIFREHPKGPLTCQWWADLIGEALSDAVTVELAEGRTAIRGPLPEDIPD